MRVLVSTKKGQGGRKNDFCFVPEGEIVTFGSECDGEAVDGGCGCRRSMCGIACHKATTTFMAAETAEMTSVLQLVSKLEASLVDGGWGEPGDKKLRKWALDDALQLTRIANSFPLGTILEKRGNAIQEREIK